jgi:hypothetical protein
MVWCFGPRIVASLKSHHRTTRGLKHFVYHIIIAAQQVDTQLQLTPYLSAPSRRHLALAPRAAPAPARARLSVLLLPAQGCRWFPRPGKLPSKSWPTEKLPKNFHSVLGTLSLSKETSASLQGRRLFSDPELARRRLVPHSHQTAPCMSLSEPQSSHMPSFLHSSHATI